MYIIVIAHLDCTFWQKLANISNKAFVDVSSKVRDLYFDLNLHQNFVHVSSEASGESVQTRLNLR